MLRVALFLSLLAVTACTPKRMAEDIEDAAQEVSRPAEWTGIALGKVTDAVGEQVENAAEAVIPQASPLAPVSDIPAAATDLTIRWEIISPAYYAKRLQGIYCPGGASGPTGAIGYDFGTQSQSTILLDWQGHAERRRLATAAGQTGPVRCNASKATLADVRITLVQARPVFEVSLIKYERIAARAFGKWWGDAHPMVRGVLRDLVYMRGGSMVGPSREEMRTIAQKCLPTDVDCIIAELQKMLRIWAGKDIEKGMRNRMNDRIKLLRTIA